MRRPARLICVLRCLNGRRSEMSNASIGTSIGGRPRFCGFWVFRSFDRWFSRLRRDLLSSCVAKKKVSKEEGDPVRRRALPGSLRYSVEAGAAELAATRLKQSSPFFRLNLRCSAPLKGPERRHGSNDVAFNACLRSDHCLGAGRFAGARGRRRATEGFAEKGRGLFEGRRPEFRSALSDAQHREEVLLGCPREDRVAQGTREAGAALGSPFLCVLSFGEAKESAARLKREKQRLNETRPQKLRADHALMAMGEPTP